MLTRWVRQIDAVPGVLRMCAAAAIVLWVAALVAAQPNGVGLAIKSSDSDGRHLVALDLQSGDTVLSLHVPANEGWRYRGPCFSPDGRRIAYARQHPDRQTIHVMDNDGGYDSPIADKPGLGECYLTWCLDSCLYWSDGNASGAVRRVNVYTGVNDTLRSFSLPLNATSQLPTRINSLTMSLDAARGASNGGDYEGVFAYDMVGGHSQWLGLGCRGTVSPGGGFMTRNTSSISLPDARNFSFHQVCIIHNIETALAGSGSTIESFLIAPGAVPEQSVDSTVPRFTAHRYSHSSDDYVVYTGQHALAPHCYVAKVSTDEHWVLAEGEGGLGNGAMAFDFWEGDLPLPRRGPRISVAPEGLVFSWLQGPSPDSQQVVVTNSGTDVLGAVQLSGVPPWLMVEGAQDGNSQVLRNRVDPAGLQHGAHHAEVRVFGGGAGNFTSYLVSVNIGTLVHAPSGLAGLCVSESQVWLSWIDNSDDEQGFVVERNAGTGWETIASLDSNATEYGDGYTTVGTCRYRVRAFAGTDSSGYSNEVVVTAVAAPGIEVVLPEEGAVLHPDSVREVRWLARGVSRVVVQYTLNHGEDLMLIGDSSFASGWPLHGGMDWDVPDTVADSVLVVVHDYADPSTSAHSGYFSISRGSSVGRLSYAAAVRAATPRRVVIAGRPSAAVRRGEWFSLCGKRLPHAPGAGCYIARGRGVP